MPIVLPNTEVACMVKDPDGDDTIWILGTVVKYNNEARKYQILDAGESEPEPNNRSKKKKKEPKTTYMVGKTRIHVLVDAPHARTDIPPDSRVIAMYPNTTVFYAATVRTSARDRKDKCYELEFDDEEPEEASDSDGEEQGASPPSKFVPARYVIVPS